MELALATQVDHKGSWSEATLIAEIIDLEVEEEE